MPTVQRNEIFTENLLGLRQHHCKDAPWLAAPLYWWIIKASVMLAAYQQAIA
jgi:hypothetical protein